MDAMVKPWHDDEVRDALRCSWGPDRRSRAVRDDNNKCWVKCRPLRSIGGSALPRVVATLREGVHARKRRSVHEQRRMALAWHLHGLERGVALAHLL